MITLMIGETEIRALHGDAAALPVLCILALSNMGLSLGHLTTATGYKRTAIVKACRTLHHLNLVDFDEPRPGDLRNIRMLTSFQLPLPGPTHTHTLPAGTVSASQEELSHSGEPPASGHGLRHIGALLAGPVAKFARSNSAHVVVGGVNQSIPEEFKQQHQQTSSPNAFRVRGLLKAAGVWPNIAEGLQETDLADVLGWIAYVSDPAQNIRSKAALVANALQNGREAVRPYRPEPICQDCRRIEPACSCGGELYWPAEYDALALKPPAPSWGVTAEEWLAKRWYCPECQAFPCQCQEAE